MDVLDHPPFPSSSLLVSLIILLKAIAFGIG